MKAGGLFFRGILRVSRLVRCLLQSKENDEQDTTMRLHISTIPLTEREWEEIEEVLLEEIEIQRWYGVTALPGFDEDVLVPIQ
jgi:hypothetical protein